LRHIECTISQGMALPTGMGQKHPDTVGQPSSTEIGMPNMPSLKARKLSQLPREKVLLEL
jgi:hypothetical protein